jgi:hypothetical protein
VARLDRKRLDAAEFPMLEDVATRFDDMDVQGTSTMPPPP